MDELFAIKSQLNIEKLPKIIQHFYNPNRVNQLIGWLNIASLFKKKKN